MTNSLISLTLQFSYLFKHMTIGQVIDISLVTLIFFVAFQALYQTRALQLLRGTIIAAILGGALLAIMPLDTLNWLVRIFLLFCAIALPILFQDELRRALVGLGQFGRRRAFISNYNRFEQILISAVNYLASRNHGALIVLEGQTPLEDIIATGIRMQAEVVTAELLEAIFFPKAPLHDGAVVLQGDRMAAASCILPIQTEYMGDEHLGTRHRAALGLSTKVPDALIIVVSEETARISIAWGGKLYYDLSISELERWLDQFGEQSVDTIRLRWERLLGGSWKDILTNFLISISLALIAWFIVIYQTNPPGQVAIQGIPLAINGLSEDLVLMNAIPSVVMVEVQTTRDRINFLSPASLRAELDFTDLQVGMHSVPVQVSAADPFAQVISVDPNSVDIQLEQEVSKIITPTVIIADLQSLPPGYAVGTPVLSPGVITITGPRSQVETVVAARSNLTIGSHRSDFQDSVILDLLNEFGKPVKDVFITPEQLIVTVPVSRVFFTREIGVQAILDEEGLDSNFEIREVEILPPAVTLTGPKNILDEVNEYLLTAPISLTHHYSDFVVDAPLQVPDGASTVNAKGETILSVKVKLTLSPVKRYLVLEREVSYVNLSGDLKVYLKPDKVSVLLVGSQELLAKIAKDPQLIRVYVDLANSTIGVKMQLLQVQAPNGIEVQLFPKDVQVAIE